MLWIRQRDVLSGAGTTAFKHTNKSDLGLKDGFVGDIFFFFCPHMCVCVQCTVSTVDTLYESV